jgi:CBS domain-containing protein
MLLLRSVKVRDYMTPNPVTFAPDMEILHAIHLLVDRKISGGPVIDARGNLVGMLTEQDCLQVALNACYHGELGGRVDEFMASMSSWRSMSERLRLIPASWISRNCS